MVESDSNLGRVCGFLVLEDSNGKYYDKPYLGIFYTENTIY